MLGRPYAISGRVSHGRRLGTRLGFPTLNLRFPWGRPALQYRAGAAEAVGPGIIQALRRVLAPSEQKIKKKKN